MTLTFVDSGVLIAAARGVGTIQQAAEAILFDPNRTFASSLFVQMEVLPKPLYFKRLGEVSYYQRFFARVAVWATCDEALVQEAYEGGAGNRFSRAGCPACRSRPPCWR